ncbi:MAG TPA: phosphoribosylformylglycinamidine cyclo-ligase [Planctomycetes bacterium]|nr:phosphoribosylformylglycinamidine cyclo-ligase [Planctomycetota bacterium]
MDSQGRYARRGVSSAKEDVHRAVAALDKGLFPAAFCRILPDVLGGDDRDALVLHADGAGTKSIVAYLLWRETGDPSHFAGIAQDAAVMNIDDMLCVGATGPFVLSSTIGRNKSLVGGEAIAAVINGFHAFAARLGALGTELVIGGGETADVGDLIRTIAVDATCAARLRRAEVIDNGAIGPGDLIVALSSTGAAAYEDKENSGIGSNGLTSARHDLLGRAYAARYPETWAPSTPESLVYSGSFSLSDALPGSSLTIGEALASPTRTYAPIIREVLARGRRLIRGMVHVTGGGQTKCLRFGGEVRYVKDNPFPVPPLFRLIRERSGSSWREMHEVFNMGHRMELFTCEEGAALIEDAAARFGVEARRIGRVERAAGRRELVIAGPDGTLAWERGLQ